MTAANMKPSKETIIKATKPLTKRQKHKLGPNKSNTWPQQPKYKSMAARDQAYIRMAGLGSQSSKSKSSSSSSSSTKAPLNANDDIINSPEYKFGRLLASPQARTRHATILKLKDYLKARTDPSNENGGLSVLDLMKLWKGLWHTLYLCDGVAVQDEVSKVLSSLIWSVGGTLEEDEYAGRFYLDLDENTMDEDDMGDVVGDDDDDDDDQMQIIQMSDEEDDDSAGDEDVDLEEDSNDMGSQGSDEDDEDVEDDVGNPADDEETKHCRGAHLSSLYIRTYFRTLNREWSKMDKYRVDKFYTLTRFVIREIYRYMASRHWNLGIIRLFNDALFEEVLRENRYGNGVRFHLLDICLDELALVNSEKETGLPLTEATYLDCMEPYFAMAQRVDDSVVHDRVMEKIMSRFLDEYSVVSDNYSKDDSDGKNKLVMHQVHVQTVAQFLFELASDSETADEYRKQLYDMHKTYVKRVKEVGRDVIMDDYDGEHANNQHVHDEGETCESCSNNTCSEENTSKKKKKKKKSDHSQEGPSHVQDLTEEPVSKATGSFNPDAEDEKQSKRKKNKKKIIRDKKVVDAQQNHDENDNGDEYTITISANEQKAALEAATKSNQKKKSSKKSNTISSSKEKVVPNKKEKKVKFDKVNKSKSYKASMNDLRNLDAKATLRRTPTKSILMKKQERR